FGAHALGDAREAGAVQFTGDEAAVVEVHLVLLLGAPLAVVEDHGGDRNVVTHAGENLDHAHGPGAVAGVSNGATFRRRGLGTNNGGQRVTAVAEAHRGEQAARFLEAQVAVGHGVDVTDVGGDHDVLGHGF